MAFTRLSYDKSYLLFFSWSIMLFATEALFDLNGALDVKDGPFGRLGLTYYF